MRRDIEKMRQALDKAVSKENEARAKAQHLTLKVNWGIFPVQALFPDGEKYLRTVWSDEDARLIANYMDARAELLRASEKYDKLVAHAETILR